VLVGPAYRIKVAPERGDALAGYAGQSIWLGMRPEAIAIRPADDDRFGVPAVVDVVSPMGANTLVYALVDGETIVADVSSDLEPAVGDRVTLFVDPARVHAFDRESERALW
jgi:multiple sugar transport system ATP-binding protein